MNEILQEVGAWSRRNFGEQMYKPRLEFHKLLVLEEAAPLLGVVEEVGELLAAYENKHALSDNDAVVDAIGDIGIYLCDFLSREGCDEFPEPEETEDNIAVLCGRLCHAYLKHHQGIRGLAARTAYMVQRHAIIARMRWCLDQIALWNTNESFDSCVQLTWNKIVSKRDWKQNASTGGADD